MLIFLAVLFVMLVLPVLLIALHAFARPASLAGLWTRTLALLLLCGLLVPAGMWIFPPWWTAYVLFGLAVMASLNAARRLRGRAKQAGAVRRHGEIGLACLIGLAAVAGWWSVIDGRQVPAGAVDIAFPLEPGRYLVINGGHNALLNPHFMTLDDPQYADFRGQSFAVDLIAVDRLGFRAENPLGAADPAGYHIFGAEVLAPCDGTVIGAEAGMIDHRVPDRDTVNLAGNHLLIDCDAFVVLLAHLRQESLRVAPGDPVRMGEVLAEVGNSGQSGEPHLHVHAQGRSASEAQLAGEPLPITFDGVFPVRNAIFMGN